MESYRCHYIIGIVVVILVM